MSANMIDRSEQQELLRRRIVEQGGRAAVQERKARQRERQRQRREAERERSKGKPRWTPAQKKLFEEIERINRATPEAREWAFWREVDEAEGVMFMGGDDHAGDEHRRQSMAQVRLDRDRRWVTCLPMSDRDEWRRAYLNENPDKAEELQRRIADG